MLYYLLNQNINGQKLIEDIQRLLNREAKESLEKSVLVISIKPITNYTGDSLLPKITYNPDCTS